MTRKGSGAVLGLSAPDPFPDSYLNIHTTTFPGGEIRGFLTPAAVPEPASLALLGNGVLGLVAYARPRRARARA